MVRGISFFVIVSVPMSRCRSHANSIEYLMQHFCVAGRICCDSSKTEGICVSAWSVWELSGARCKCAVAVWFHTAALGKKCLTCLAKAQYSNRLHAEKANKHSSCNNHKKAARIEWNGELSRDEMCQGLIQKLSHSV